jgi:hypothetical protein
MAIQITPRDRILLATLTRKVRVLTIAQIARTWFADSQTPLKSAWRRLHTLRAEGLVDVILMMAHPEIQLRHPAIAWKPGSPMPSLGEISYRLRARWTEPMIGTRMAVATDHASHRFGGYVAGRRPRRSEATHDIHVAQLYLRLLRERPAYAKRWISEQELYVLGGGRNEKLPDALIRNSRRDSDIVVEFGGAYSKPKLAEFHEAEQHRRYELW